jgi:Fe-S cluster biosynthesis and repair protein YggX
MDTSSRIAQWENMTQADPTNDMAWFSLGNAYRDAHRPSDADRALAKAIELNPDMSRAYQLRGQALIELNQPAQAADLLTRGYIKAAERGDTMPQKAIESLLTKLGKPIPKTQAAPTPPTAPTGGNTVLDRRTGRVGTRMPDPPMRGPLGKFIFENFSQETWREWIGQGTKVINEFRLDFSNDEHQKVYERNMMEWLGITPADLENLSPKN